MRPVRGPGLRTVLGRLAGRTLIDTGGFKDGGKQIEVDEDGYIQNLDDWSEDVANFIAQQESVEMTDVASELLQEAVVSSAPPRFM